MKDKIINWIISLSNSKLNNFWFINLIVIVVSHLICSKRIWELGNNEDGNTQFTTSHWSAHLISSQDNISLNSRRDSLVESGRIQISRSHTILLPRCHVRQSLVVLPTSTHSCLSAWKQINSISIFFVSFLYIFSIFISLDSSKRWEWIELREEVRKSDEESSTSSENTTNEVKGNKMMSWGKEDDVKLKLSKNNSALWHFIKIFFCHWIW